MQIKMYGNINVNDHCQRSFVYGLTFICVQIRFLLEDEHDFVTIALAGNTQQKVQANKKNITTLLMYAGAIEKVHCTKGNRSSGMNEYYIIRCCAYATSSSHTSSVRTDTLCK